MLFFFAFTYHARKVDWLRGRKLAYVVFYGFTTLLAVYIVRGLLNLTTYNFLDKAS